MIVGHCRTNGAAIRFTDGPLESARPRTQYGPLRTDSSWGQPIRGGGSIAADAAGRSMCVNGRSKISLMIK